MSTLLESKYVNHPGGTYDITNNLPYDVEVSYKSTRKIASGNNYSGTDFTLLKNKGNSKRFRAVGNIDWINIKRVGADDSTYKTAQTHTRLNDGLCKYSYGRKSMGRRKKGFHLQGLTINKLKGRYVISHECVKAHR